MLPSLRLSTPGLVGRAGSSVVLSTVARLVASGTAVSKADLVPAAGLARTTVSTAVDELLDRGVLRLDGTRPTPGRGRPADRLALAPDGGHVLLADVGARGAHLAVVDLAQRVLAHEHVDVDVRDGPEAVLTLVEARLDALRATTRRAPVRSVVIGLPGPVDGRLGAPVRPPIMPGWHAFPVAARLGARFGCPAAVENDVNLRALGEARALPADQAPLLFVKVGTGIGGGLVDVTGGLHHGADGAAGDIGHVRVRGAPDEPCVCGNVGCIEAVASAGALVRRLGMASIAELRAALARGDPAAVAAVRDAAGLIGELVATLVHLWNPARVTLGGALTAASDELLAGVRAVAYRRALPLATRNLVLAGSALGEYAGLAGAAVLGIERVLSADAIGLLTQDGRGRGANAGTAGAESRDVLSDVIGPVTAGSPVVHVAGFVALLLVGLTGTWAGSLVTIAHEGGHVVTAALSGRNPSGFVINEGSGGGRTDFGGEWGVTLLPIYLAGYMTPPLLGLAGANLVLDGKAWSVLWAVLILLVGPFLAAMDRFTNVVVVLVGVGVGWVAVTGSPDLQALLAVTLVWWMLIGGVTSLVPMGLGTAGSDADQLARNFLVPAVLWVALFWFVAIVCLWVGGRRLLGF